ncbi:MAG: CD0415/CD1112 family protein [Faecalibacterium sp.]|nr:CD0415/CD1112 family protein [Faecalibacterium sp.]
METVLKAISDWIKSLLTAAIMSNLSGLFDDVNTQVGNIAQQAGTKPSAFEPRVFAMIEALSRNVVLPIAGIILTFIACYELIQMITEHNNMAQFEPALLMKWIFKTAVSVWLISNTFEIIMAVFDVTQQVVANSSGIISGNTRVNEVGLSMLEASMMQMEVGPLFGLFLQSFFIGITMRILSIVIFVIVYGRMIEIYCMVSLAPIPMATWGNHEQSHIGQNYLKSLFALGFQGFLILICVAVYAVLIQNVAISGDAINSIWSMFTQRTIRPERVVTSVDSPSEALAVSIGEHGKVDLPYMEELLGTPGEYAQITSELSGVIFKDPNADPADPEAGWQMADGVKKILKAIDQNFRASLRTAEERPAAGTGSQGKTRCDHLQRPEGHQG